MYCQNVLPTPNCNATTSSINSTIQCQSSFANNRRLFENGGVRKQRRTAAGTEAQGLRIETQYSETRKKQHLHLHELIFIRETHTMLSCLGADWKKQMGGGKSNNMMRFHIFIDFRDDKHLFFRKCCKFTITSGNICNFHFGASSKIVLFTYDFHHHGALTTFPGRPVVTGRRFGTSFQRASPSACSTAFGTDVAGASKAGDDPKT